MTRTGAMKDLKYPHIAKKLIDYLEEKISSGQFPAGSKIPSLRDLSGQFELDIGAVRRAIDYLAANALLEKRPGSGNFVMVKTAKGKKGQERIAVLLGDETPSVGVFYTALLGMQKAAAEHEVQLLQSFSFRAMPVEKANELIAECDATAIFGADEYGSKCASLNFRSPTVAICAYESFGGSVSTVDMDPFDSAEQAAAFFKGKGLSSVVVVSHEAPCYRNRGRVFATRWREQGGEAEELSSEAELQPDKRKGYLFTTGGVMQEHCVRHKARFGGKLSAELCILGLDGKCLIDPSFERAPTIAIDWQTAGRYALEECLYRMRSPGASPRRIYLPGRLCE